MIMKRLFVAPVLLIWMLLLPVGVFGQAVVDGNFVYTLSGTEATLIGALTPASGDVVIPSTMQHGGTTYDVTAISWNDPLCVSPYKTFYDASTTTSMSAPSIKRIVGHPINDLIQFQPQNAEIMFYGRPIVSIDFPNLELIKDCGFIKGCNSLTSVNLPKLKTLDKVRFLSECSAITSVSLPSLVSVLGMEFCSSLPNLEVLDLPNLESLVGDPWLVSDNIIYLDKLSTLNTPKLKEVSSSSTLSSLSINTFNFAQGCKLEGSSLFRGLTGSTITINGATEFSGSYSFVWNTNLREIVMPDLQVLSDAMIVYLASSDLQRFEAPKLSVIKNTTFDPASGSFKEFITGELSEITNSELFASTSVKELKVSSTIKGDGQLHLTNYPTVIKVFDRGPVVDNTTIFADIKGGRIIVPAGKAALCVDKWNIDVNKTMVYTPLKLSKTTSSAKYASGSITAAESLTAQDGNTYVNYYDLRNAMLPAECEDGAVLGPNDAGFASSAALPVRERTAVMDACQIYTAGAYADTSTPSVGDLTLDAVTPAAAGTVQGFGTSAASLYTGLNDAIDGFLFKGNTDAFTTLYAPYVGTSVTSPATNYLKAGKGTAVTTKTNGNHCFCWHPGDAAYNEGFYVSRGVTIPEARAYLAIPLSLSANAKSFRMFFRDGNTTNIVSPHIDDSDNADNDWYTISGTRLSAKPAVQGIFVHGGKKVIIK